MCGIFAVFEDSSIKRTTEQMKARTDGFNELEGRGPENWVLKYNIDGSIIGFRRLSIMDPTTAGMQPFVHYKKNIPVATVVCNGEIYNHRDMEIKYGIIPKSGSDCEFLLDMYVKHPNIPESEWIPELDGDFAIIIYDSHAKHLFFARDRIGVRPLYLGKTDLGGIALASIPTALTPFCTNIIHLPPHIFHMNLRTSINFKDINDIKALTTEYTYRWPVMNRINVDAARIKATLTRAVEARLMSDRPIGCLLSGGLDSSIVAALIEERVSDLHTFSIGMAGSPDLHHAKIVADKLGTNHHEIIFTPQEGFDAIEQVIKDIGSYDITTIRASVPMWLLARWISRNTNIKVVMSGEGSDELFGGYLYFHHAPNDQAFMDQCMKRVREIYLYDGLRADRCISTHGLELRVPFLSAEMVDTVLGMHGRDKRPKNGIEKHILREAFADMLPHEVAWRRKDGMSDGVSSAEKTWYQMIQEYVTEKYQMSEREYYKKVFKEHFGESFKPTIDYWMPEWVVANDPSGRLVQLSHT